MTAPTDPLFSVVLLRSRRSGTRAAESIPSMWEGRENALEVLPVEPDQSHAISVVAGRAAGRYLAFLEVGDTFDAERLEAFRRAIRICDSFGWGYTGVEPTGPTGRPVDLGSIGDDALRSAFIASRDPGAAALLPAVFAPVCGGNLVVETELFHRVGGWAPSETFPEWDLSLRLLLEADPVVLERPLLGHPVLLRGGHQPAPGRSSAPAEVDAARSSMVAVYRSRLADQLPLGSNALQSPGRAFTRDERAAIAASLWALHQLRRVPGAYRVVRHATELLRAASIGFRNVASPARFIPRVRSRRIGGVAADEVDGDRREGR